MLARACELGCHFDGWHEHFRASLWEEAFSKTGIDGDAYALQARDEESVLPWDMLDYGVTKQYLQSEWRKAQAACVTDDCRHGCTGCGIKRLAACEMEGSL